MPVSPRPRIRFGDFEVDVAAGELRKGGKRVRLQEQPFRILRSLLERPGQVVTREELRKEIWGDDVYVDFDRSLNTSVARLREALGDSPTRPVYIETVPRKGYRFIAPAEHGTAVPASVPAEPDNPEQGAFEQRPDAQNPRRRFWRRRLTLALGCAGIAALIFWLSPSKPPATDAPLTATRLTYYDGIEGEADFSPDGSQVVFTWDGEKQDNFDVYIKTTGGPGAIRLTADPRRDFGPAWSPDGQWIAFLRELGDDRAAVYRIPAVGGGEERLLEIESPLIHIARSGAVHSYICWALDSQHLVIPDRRSAGEGRSLFLFAPSSGTRRLLTAADAGAIDHNPRFSPDGKKLAFIRTYLTRSRIHVLPWALDDGLDPVAAPAALNLPFGLISGFSWGGGAEQLVVAVGAYEARLFSVRLGRAGAPEPLPWGSNKSFGPDISPDAQRLVFTQASFASNTWRLELERRLPTGKPTKLISSAGYSGNAHYSPDGAKIAFNSNRLPGLKLWIADAEGAKGAPLFYDDRNHGTPRWSPNGRRLAFDMQSERGDFDIWVVGAQGGPPKQLTQGSPDDRVPRWSRDGKWVYFASERGDGFQLWKRSVETGAEIQMTQDGGFHAIEDVDSRFVYVAKRNGGLWKVAADGAGTEEQVLDSLSSWANFAVVEEGIYFSPAPKEDGASVIQFYSFADSSITDVYQMDRPASIGLDVSPDGKYLLFAQTDLEGSDLMLVENFR